jgi:hypothetical protein
MVKGGKAPSSSGAVGKTAATTATATTTANTTNKGGKLRQEEKSIDETVSHV